MSMQARIDSVALMSPRKKYRIKSRSKSQSIKQLMPLMPKHYRSNSFSCFSRLTTKIFFKVFREEIQTKITSSSKPQNSRITCKLP